MWPIDTMVDAGMNIDTAYSLLHELTDASAPFRRSLLQNAVHVAKTTSGMTIKVAGDNAVYLDAGGAAALCKAASYHNNPDIRRTLAILMGKERWTGGLELLGHLFTDENDQVKQEAMASLRKISNPLYRVLANYDRLFADFGNVPNIVDDQSIFDVSEPLGAPPASDDRGYRGQDAPGAPSPSVPDSPSPTDELPATTIRRFTDIDYEPDVRERHKGTLKLCFKVKRDGDLKAAVDIRVRKAKQFATLVVHASSIAFKTSPEIQYIKVPRNSDSEAARINVEAEGKAVGDVRLTVFDETRLIGSLLVKLEASTQDNALVLQELKSTVFRDPASSADVPGLGLTIQLSLRDGVDGRINFHALNVDKSGKLELVALGTSQQGIHVGGLLAGLKGYRDLVNQLANSTQNPARREEVFKTLELKFKALGQKILKDLLSEPVQGILAAHAPESVVHWVIKDDALDVIPWELAFQKWEDSPVSEPPLLVRVPVWTKTNERPAADAGATGALKRIAYVLGTKVTGLRPGEAKWGELVKSFLQVVGKASKAKFELKPNFSETELQPFSIAKFHPFIKDARIVYILCHGVDTDNDFYLELQAEEIGGQLRPLDIYACPLSNNPLVFVNACSSGASSVSGGNFTSFGKSFVVAGASVYIGTLATVVTESALKFATAFFDACLGEGMTIASAMSRVRQEMARGADPTWRLYSIYGDLQTADALFK
jgi:hypothetical protein